MGKTKSVPEGHHSVMVYLNIKNADKAMDFYKKAFGATEVGRLAMPDGKIAHAELQFGDSRIMLAEANEEWGNKSPESYGGSPVGLCLYAENVDQFVKRCLDNGAKIHNNMEVKDQFYGDRSGTIKDPFGHCWTIATHIEDVSFPEMQKRMEKEFAQQGQN
jgi:PhnB protein